MHQPSEQTLSPQEAIAALQWLAEAGVDDTIGDSTADWFAFDAAPPPPPVANITSAPVATPKTDAPVAEAAPIYTSQGTAALIAAAREAADACNTLDELRTAITAFEGCALKKLATNMVFADGNADSGLMLVGDAPDGDDDREGIPFSGITGKLLDKMFAAIGLSREGFYVTNSVFWRPPGNRTPTEDELAICAPFVEKHIALAKPKHLVLLGAVPAKILLKSDSAVSRLRGRTHAYKNDYMDAPIPAFVLFHPNNLMQSPNYKAFAWQDLLSIKAAIEA